MSVNRIRTKLATDATTVKLRWTDEIRSFYVEGGTGAPPVGTLSFTMRGNSVYDPDYPDVTGDKSALGLGAYTDLYDNYIVTGAKLSVTFSNNALYNGQTNLVPERLVGILATNNASDVGNNWIPNTLAGQPYTRMAMLTSPTGSKNTCTLSMYMTSGKMLGVPNITTLWNIYGAAVGQNPTQQWYFKVFARTRMGTINVSYQPKMTFYVKFFGRKSFQNEN